MTHEYLGIETRFAILGRDIFRLDFYDLGCIGTLIESLLELLDR